MPGADLRIVVDDRLALRAWREADIATLFGIVAANRAYLANWLEWAADWSSVERARDGTARGTALELALEYDGVIAGGVGLAPIDVRGGAGEIGYWVREDRQGRGLVTRSCRALIEHARATPGLSHFVIRVAAENARSRAVAERLGGALLAIRAEVAPPARGRSGDEAVYVLDPRRRA